MKTRTLRTALLASLIPLAGCYVAAQPLDPYGPAYVEPAYVAPAPVVGLGWGWWPGPHYVENRYVVRHDRRVVVRDRGYRHYDRDRSRDRSDRNRSRRHRDG